MPEAIYNLYLKEVSPTEASVSLHYYYSDFDSTGSENFLNWQKAFWRRINTNEIFHLIQSELDIWELFLDRDDHWKDV